MSRYSQTITHESSGRSVASRLEVRYLRIPVKWSVKEISASDIRQDSSSTAKPKDAPYFRERFLGFEDVFPVSWHWPANWRKQGNSMPWTNEQTQFCRGLIGHYCSTLGVSVDEMAETSGVSRQRLRSFTNNTLGELSSYELDSLFEVMGELAHGEKRDIDEGQQSARTYQDVINEVIMQTGGESK